MRAAAKAAMTVSSLMASILLEEALPVKLPHAAIVGETGLAHLHDLSGHLVRMRQRLRVFAGALNLSGGLEVETTATGQDTLLAEIARLMQTAEQGRAPSRTGSTSSPPDPPKKPQRR